MTCVAIYPQPEAGSRKPEADSLTAKCPGALANRVAFLLLFAGLLGLSTQLHAALACTGVEDGGLWCRDVEIPDYDAGFSQDGNTGSTGMPDSGGTGGQTGFGDGGGTDSATADAIKAAAYEIEPHESNPENRATCDVRLEIKIKYAYYEIGKSRKDTLFTGRRPVPGEAYTITYIGSGETEAWIAGPYVGLTPEMVGAPIPGTCG